MMQLTKVWWDGERLMTKPIDPAAIYKKPEQPSQQGWKLREVYFDEHGEPTMHKDPEDIRARGNNV